MWKVYDAFSLRFWSRLQWGLRFFGGSLLLGSSQKRSLSATIALSVTGSRSLGVDASREDAEHGFRGPPSDPRRLRTAGILEGPSDNERH